MKTLKYLIPIIVGIILIMVACGRWNSDCVEGCKPDTTDQRTPDPTSPNPPVAPGVGPTVVTDDPSTLAGCQVSPTGLVTCGTTSYQIPPGTAGTAGTNGVQGVAGASGTNGKDGVNGTNGTNGTNGIGLVYEIVNPTLLQCPAGGQIIVIGRDSDQNDTLDTGDTNIQTAVVCNGVAGATGATGAKGDQGVQGTQGAQGTQGVAGTNGANGQDGTNGTNGKDGTNGTNGVAGTNGTNGTNGKDGTNGTNGINGTNGANGTNATSPFLPTALVTPCGPNSSPWKEVLLCLQDGTLLGSFSDTQSGYNTRLAVIPSGTYIDTDSSGCTFSVNATGSKTTVSWGAGSNAYSTWTAGSSSCGQ